MKLIAPAAAQPAASVQRRGGDRPAACVGLKPLRIDLVEYLAVFDWLGILRQDLLRMTPEYSDSISFMIFIASMMQSVCPFETRSPTRDVRLRARFRRLVERPDHRRLHLERRSGFGGLENGRATSHPP